MVDLPRIFTDAAFRRQAVGRLNDPVGLVAGWAWFESVPERDRLTMLGPVFNKVWALTARRAVRDVLGQAAPRITLSRVLAERKILIVNLSKGILGGEASRLFGALIVTGLWQAATQRASLSVDERPAFMAYLDELQDLLAVRLSPSTRCCLRDANMGWRSTLPTKTWVSSPPRYARASWPTATARFAFGSSRATRGLWRELSGRRLRRTTYKPSAPTRLQRLSASRTVVRRGR